MPTCMTGPVPSTPVQGSGGAPLATIQDSPAMGPDIDRVIPITTATPQAGPLLIPVGQASILRLHRMHRHECSGDRTRCKNSSGAVH